MQKTALTEACLILCTTLALSTAAMPAFAGQGVFGGAISWLGDRTGVKPLTKLGNELDNASSDIKKAVPGYKALEEGVTKPVAETVKWADNNRETAVAIVAVAASIAVACADGCSLAMYGLAQAGGTGGVLLFNSENSKKHQAPSANASPAQPSSPGRPTEPASQKPAQSATTKDTTLGSDVLTPLGRRSYDFPRAYRQTPNSSGAPYRTTYVTERDDLHRVLTRYDPRYLERSSYSARWGPAEDVMRTFHTKDYLALTTARVPGDGDMAGGLFSSPRNDNVAEWAVVEYGKGARRVHGSIDMRTMPGSFVPAPLTGEVLGWKLMGGKKDLGMLTIKSPDGTVSNMLYVEPTESLRKRLLLQIKTGAKVQVRAGDMIVRAQNIGIAYDLSKVPNHIHVEFHEPSGRRAMPWTDEAVEPYPWAPRSQVEPGKSPTKALNPAAKPTAGTATAVRPRAG